MADPNDPFGSLVMGCIAMAWGAFLYWRSKRKLVRGNSGVAAIVQPIAAIIFLSGVFIAGESLWSFVNRTAR